MNNSRKPRRRYEILLPLRYNDGTKVPKSLVGDTLREVRAQFGMFSLEGQIIRGAWQHDAKVYVDKLARVFVDVPDTDENRKFFVDLKERLKERFDQVDVYLVSYTVDPL